MERKSYIERIIGGSQEEKNIASKKLEARVGVPGEENEQLKQYEIEKTPEDIEMINFVIESVDRMIAEYGGHPKQILMDDIRLLKPGSISIVTDGRLANGMYTHFEQTIHVEKDKSLLLLVARIAHELFHVKSYKSARIGASVKDVRLYRSGLVMVDRKDHTKEASYEKQYFGILEEAIVAECERLFLNETKKNILFKEEVNATNQLMAWVLYSVKTNGTPKQEEMAQNIIDELICIPNAQHIVQQVLAHSRSKKSRSAYTTGFLSGMYKDGSLAMMSRRQEREKLYVLLDEIIAKSNNEFKTRDVVFAEFAKANFTGNYLPLARIIERILGKGAFRKIAEEFSEQREDE